MMGQPDPAAEEQRILEVVKELCQQLNIPKYNPVAVSWTAFVPRGQVLAELPLDQCHLTWDQVMLPQAMRGKLEPYEWKPLLASSLIFSKKFKGKIVTLGVGIVAVFAVLNLLGWLLLPPLFPYTTNTFAGQTAVDNPAYFILLFGVMPLSIFLGAFLGVKSMKKVRLEADNKAAELAGKQVFLSVLRKIVGQRPETVAEARKRSFRGATPWVPRTAERIAHLEST